MKLMKLRLRVPRSNEPFLRQMCSCGQFAFLSFSLFLSFLVSVKSVKVK